MIRDFDSPWKETLELFLQPILQMFFYDIHDQIDWSKGYESLDTELHAIVGDAELGATWRTRCSAFICAAAPMSGF